MREVDVMGTPPCHDEHASIHYFLTLDPPPLCLLPSPLHVSVRTLILTLICSSLAIRIVRALDRASLSVHECVQIQKHNSQDGGVRMSYQHLIPY